MKSHLKRGEMARRKRLADLIYRWIEIMAVTGCNTVEEVRTAHAEGRFETSAWLEPSIMPMLMKYPDLKPRERRRCLNSIAREYEQKIVQLMAEDPKQ